MSEKNKKFVDELDKQELYQFTKEQIDRARGNLSPMHDRVATVTFDKNKNNHIITGLADLLKKLYNEPPIPPIESTVVQDISLEDVMGYGMVADMTSEGLFINVATEIQRKSQAAFAVRGTLTSSNLMKNQFLKGSTYSEAPDVIGIYIVGFNMPEFMYKKEFVTRIGRTDLDYNVPFLVQKYSDFYIELSKSLKWKKNDLSEKYHELWDFCVILNTKIKDQDEVIKMNAISSPLALEMASASKTAVMPDVVVRDALVREREKERLVAYIDDRERIAYENGNKNRAKETVINLLTEKVDINIISRSTGLSIEDIEAIEKDLLELA